MDGSVEEVGADDCGVKVAVPSEVATVEICTTEFVGEAGVVEKDAGLVGAQASRNVVRHNIARPDRSCLMKVPWIWFETSAEPRQSATTFGENRYNIDQIFSLLADFRISRTSWLAVGINRQSS